MFEDVKKIQSGIADKAGMCIQNAFGFIGGLVVAMVFGWKLGLVCLATLPILALAGYIFMVASSDSSKEELDNYAEAGGIAEEVLGSIKTVTAFNGQKFENSRYGKPLFKSQNLGVKKAAYSGFANGFFNLAMFSVYCIAFWYGSELVISDEYDIGTKLIVFFGVVIGGFGLSMVGTNLEHMATAQSAAFSVFEIIDRVPEIDIYSEKGEKPAIKGRVEFCNVDFTYPARTETGVLSSVSFTAEAGETTAFCGPSGCGKSTCFQLIQRFYDAAQGRILIDGMDIKDINLAWFRQNVGVVSQEPILFEGTVEENITLGRLDVTKEEIIAACKQANAYDFIQKLPSAWDTQVGEGGATLSGGQKQRVAIARALVRNPKILLLDEATSALDTESEKIVQQALEKASVGRTTLVIAHRLSTIKNADKIIGFKNGKKIEEGNHETLMQIEDGIYNALCNMQTFANDDEKKIRDAVQKVLFSQKYETSLHAASTHKLESSTSIKESSKTELAIKKAGDDESDEEIAKREGLPEVSFGQILGMNSPEWFYIFVGSLFACFNGAVQPIWAIIFSGVLEDYSTYNCAYNKEISALSSILFWSLMFVVLGGALFVGFIVMSWMFGLSGELLTTRLRKKSFAKLLRLDMSYFDDNLNSTGNLTARLASDAGKVQGATGRKIGEGVMNIGAFGCGLTIAFYYSWQLALIVFAFMPFMIVANALMMQVMTDNHGGEEQKKIENASKVATECTANIRTVAGLGREKHFAKLYDKNMEEISKGKSKGIIAYGFLYGSTLAIMYFMYAGIFRFSMYLIDAGIMDASRSSDIFRCLFALVFAGMSAGQSAGLAPDYGKAVLAARRIFKLFDTESTIDPESTEGEKPEIRGDVEFTGVEFSYPTRNDLLVLKGLKTSVQSGKTLALVGQSGCGKSTCISLIERFYNASAGNVTIDGIDISKINLKWLRANVGLVQQEPVLFVNGIFISQKYSQNEIEAALREANAYDFVMDLPERLETRCGKKGSQLSGGQKQRIAIARALIRKPKILLLDEATSALDTESEKIVQDALDKARKGRTCILIAHRLSTVINADIIAVVDNGVIVESGKHQDLIDRRGAYFNLIKSQL
ncbi:unnamed protein product [Oikopleura dioica]|uniref:Uncharacterized protein n=1 Tax=Oikopleura dioica TaxID=34765 RepID=E4Y8T5_OIKDI|nr:unnamed protein product [Oikopleura dioica]